MARPIGPRRVNFFPVPQPPDWLPIDWAIAGQWNIMLCWDVRARGWRCDFIKPGRIASGTGALFGAAVTEAWAATDRAGGDTHGVLRGR